MSEMTLAEQTEELRKAGIPVRQGAPVISGPEHRTIARIGAEHWLPIWAKQAFANAPLVMRGAGVRFLADSCAGLPAFVVGCGPSLDGDIETLKQAQGCAIIIASDAAFRPLMAKGIKPDLVLSLDAKAEQKLLWEGVPPHEVPCLFDTCSHPDSIGSWAGPIMFYNHWHQSDEFSRVILPAVFPHIGQIPSGGTVGNMAYFLSKLLGCSASIVVGMDFCYGYGDPYKKEGWVYRSKDYKWILDGPDQKSGWQPTQVKALYDNDARLARSFVRSMGGTQYRTDPELEFYYQTFNLFKQNFKIETVNCSVDGMLAQSCETIPLAAAIERFCKKDLQGGRTVLPHLGAIVPDPRQHVE